MNKKAQVPGGPIGAVIGIIILIIVVPLLMQALNDVTCQNEKSQIESLKNQLSNCQNDLATEKTKTNSALQNLEDCNKLLAKCKEELDGCGKECSSLKQELGEKEQPITEYYFIKIYSNKMILFDQIILYHIVSFGLFLSLGITFTLKLFEVDIEIKVLNKKNQRKLVKTIRKYLAENPYTPLIIMVVITFITNLIR